MGPVAELQEGGVMERYEYIGEPPSAAFVTALALDRDTLKQAMIFAASTVVLGHVTSNVWL